ncbi:TIGR02594 family protein [Terriglobus sp. RCC_193]|uniref:TIGR02594 family protein n=1 Tax=Terriglobus sp. RCC_193 TaxID=3239218 RepID=UPI0035264A99
MPITTESVMPEPSWLVRARVDIGIKEAPGIADNAVIVGWARSLGYAWVAKFYAHDSIPWCALWMAHIMHDDGKAIPPQKDVLGALNWRLWGTPLHRAVPGAVLVFTRSGGGHVGLYVGEDETHYHVLGGNQGDMVRIARVPRFQCVAIRWPSEVFPYGNPVMMAASAAPASVTEA